MELQQAYGSLSVTERHQVTDLVRHILDLHRQGDVQTHESDCMWRHARVCMGEAEQLERLRRNATRSGRIATLHADARYYAERARGHLAEADDISEEVARVSDVLRELLLAASGEIDCYLDRGAGVALIKLIPLESSHVSSVAEYRHLKSPRLVLPAVFYMIFTLTVVTSVNEVYSNKERKRERSYV